MADKKQNHPFHGKYENMKVKSSKIRIAKKGKPKIHVTSCSKMKKQEVHIWGAYVKLSVTIQTLCCIKADT